MAASAYLSTVAAHAEAEAQRQRALQEESRQSQRAIFQSVLANPNATQDQRAYAIDNLNKLNQGAGSKKGQSPYDVLGDHLSRVGQHLQDAGHPEASNPGVLHTLPQLDGSGAQPTSAQASAPSTPSIPSAPTSASASLPGTSLDAGPTTSAPSSTAPTQLPPLGDQAGDSTMAQKDNASTSTSTSTPPSASDPSAAPIAAAAASALTPSNVPVAPSGGIAPSPASAGAQPVSLPPIAPIAPSTVGQHIEHGAGRVLSFLGNRLAAARDAYSQPGISLPPLAPDIDPAMIPSPALQPTKWNPTPSKGTELPAEMDSDMFGNPIDPAKSYKTGVRSGKLVAIPANANPSNMAPRSIGTTVSLDDARQLANTEGAITDPQGRAYDLSKIPENMKFQAVGLPGGKIAYVLGTERQVKRTNGNENYIVNEFDQADPSKYTATGQARTPTSHSAPGVDLEGNIGTVVTGNQPSTPGMAGAAGSAGATSLPALNSAPISLPALHTPSGATGIPPARPPRAMTPQASQPGQPPTTSLTHSGSGAVIPFGAAASLNQRIVPVREASTALFGDPTTRVSNLADFAHIADSPQSAQKVATAVRTTLDGMESDAQSEGGIFQLMQNASGFSAYKTKIANSVLGDQLAAMSPEEQRAYDALLTTYSTIIGLRTLTKASAAKFSAKALENEIPIPGYNSASREQFYDQMAHLAEQVHNGAKTLPMPASEKAQIAQGVKNFVVLSQQSTAKPSGLAVSLKDAMALPINKGKSADEVRADIKSHGHEVRE